MSETGATPAQIEAAARRRLAAIGGEEKYAARLAEYAGMYAEYLVPPDHRIVSVADLAALLDITDDNGARLPDSEWSEAWDRIRALIGGAS